MTKPDFVYVTYIATTAEKLWQALTEPGVTSRWYRLATTATTPLENVSDWKAGSPWQRRRLDEARTVDIVGTVLECTPARRLALTWAGPGDSSKPEMISRVTFDIEPKGEELVKLTLRHDDLDPEMHRRVSGGWPQALSNLKTLLETGHSLPRIVLVDIHEHAN